MKSNSKIETVRKLAKEDAGIIGQGCQLCLGWIYEEGEDVPRDLFEAVKWFRKAAKLGNSEGQFSLGKMYEKGNGVPKNLVEAYAWFNLAAASGHAAAMECVRSWSINWVFNLRLNPNSVVKPCLRGSKLGRPRSDPWIKLASVFWVTIL